MIKRSIYYWSKMYSVPLGKGMAYKELRPVIAINILNFSMFSQTEHFHTSYHLYEDEDQFKLTNEMEFHFIEIEKLMKETFENWENLSMEREQREAYEGRLKRIMDEEAAKREEELREQEAEQKGKQEGIQEEREMIARRLLEKGMGVKFVADSTGLNVDKINEIQRDIYK